MNCELEAIAKALSEASEHLMALAKRHIDWARELKEAEEAAANNSLALMVAHREIARLRELLSDEHCEETR